MTPLLIYTEFFKIGLFSIGGGLATLPFLFQLAARYPWLSPETVGNNLAIAQSAPGAVGVNMSMLAGFCSGAGTGSRLAIMNAALAGLGLVTPSIIIIIIVARALAAFKENIWVQAAFSGLRPAAAGLLAAAAFGALKTALLQMPEAANFWSMFKWRECLLFIAAFALMRKFKFHPIVYIAAAGIIGIVWQL
jgi:chromate transporter